MMSRVRSVARSNGDPETEREGAYPFKHVSAFVVGLENYRAPNRGEALPSVDFANADADAFADAIQQVYSQIPDVTVSVDKLNDGGATLGALRDDLRYAIKSLSEDDLFIFYYAGHGFHVAGDNRLSTWETNASSITETSLSLRDDLLDPLQRSSCRRALIFIDACAEKFRSVIDARDVIQNLNPDEVEEFLDAAWYCGVFLSCSPGEQSYPAKALGHGIWTHFLLEALLGRAPDALRDQWLTDSSLRDYLMSKVTRYITEKTSIRARQTPASIIEGSNTFRIRYVPRRAAAPVDETLAGIRFQNGEEYLEGDQSGKIRDLPKFNPRSHHVPRDVNTYSDNWCRELLADKVSQELQEMYARAIEWLPARRKDLTKAEDTGTGSLDHALFRYSVKACQDPVDPARYVIHRKLVLRPGWDTRLDAIKTIFVSAFRRVVIEFDAMDCSYDDLVDKLEDVRDAHGGEIDDDDRVERVSYTRDGMTLTFDLKQDRLEISNRGVDLLKLIDAAQVFKLGAKRKSLLLQPRSSEVGAGSLRLTIDAEAREPQIKRRRSPD